jgi:hypothetical protein
MTEVEKPKRRPPVGERSVRLPDALLLRGVALIPALQQTSVGMGLRWNETAVARLALARGLEVLEAELAPVAAAPVAQRKRSAKP